MLVGFVAKLIAALILILLAVGLYVGGGRLASLFDGGGRGSPPTAVPTQPEPQLNPPLTPAPPRASGRATTKPTARMQPLAPNRPSRGALRPTQGAPAARKPAPQQVRPAAAIPAPPTRPDSQPRLAAVTDSAPTAAALAEEIPPEAPEPQPPAVPAGAPEPVLLDLELGRLVSQTVAAYRDGEAALVPLGTFFDLAEIGHGGSASGVFEARLEPSGEDIRIVAGGDSAIIGTRTLAVRPTEVILRDGEMYMATDPLGRMLGLSFQVDWPDLRVSVLDPDSLPVARRIRRDQLRALLAQRNGAHADTTLGLPNTQWDGVVLDYNLTFPYATNLVSGAGYQLGLGAQVGGGSLDLGLRSVGSIESGESEFAATWKGVWIDNKWVKQLTLGTTTLTGPRYAGIRGVALTNSPYVRPNYVGQLDYYGRLPPGWQLEAYSGAQLVAFDSIGATGDYNINLPVGYGENPVDFIAYGPSGQVRRFNQTYRVVSEQLPYRQFEYGVAVGDCITTLCNGALNADLHYGLSRRVTVRGGLEGYSRRGLDDLVHPYGVVTGLVGNSITLEGEAVGNGWLRGAVRLEPSLDFRLAAGYTTFETDVERSVIAPAGRRSQWLFDGFLRPLPSIPSFYFQALAELDDGVDFDATRARLQASVQADGVRLYPYARLERMRAPTGPATGAEFLGVTAYANALPTWGKVLSGLWFRGDLETDLGGGWTLAAASVARSFGPALRIEGGAAWRQGIPGTTFTLSLVSYLPTLQATTTAVAPTEGDGGVIQTVQGALIYDPHQGRVTANPNPGIQRSGVSGVVFVDANANGRRDPDEEGAAGVRVVVGSFNMLSDSAGRYHVWDIPAFEPVRVEVDSTSLDNPLFVPAFATASVQPPPNAYRQLDLPLVTGAVLEGRVIRDGAPISGLTLLLTNRGSGRQRTIETFTDGSFYVMGVKPGQYTIEVDPRDLAARRLAGASLPFTASAEHPEQLSGLVLEVHAGGAPAR